MTSTPTTTTTSTPTTTTSTPTTWWYAPSEQKGSLALMITSTPVPKAPSSEPLECTDDSTFKHIRSHHYRATVDTTTPEWAALVRQVPDMPRYLQATVIGVDSYDTVLPGEVVPPLQDAAIRTPYLQAVVTGVGPPLTAMTKAASVTSPTAATTTTTTTATTTTATPAVTTTTTTTTTYTPTTTTTTTTYTPSATTVYSASTIPEWTRPDIEMLRLHMHKNRCVYAQSSSSHARSKTSCPTLANIILDRFGDEPAVVDFQVHAATVITDVNTNSTNFIMSYDDMMAMSPLVHETVPRFRAPAKDGVVPLRTEPCSQAQVAQKVLAALNGFDLTNSGLILAGGAISHFVLTDAPLPKRRDLDLFCVGLTSDEARDVIVRLMHHLRPKMVYRTRNAISFRRRKQPLVQVILRLYSGVAQMLYGVDLACTAGAWDGQKLWLTPAAAMSLRTKTNFVDTHVYTNNYEERLCRYFYRGFDLLVPNVDMTDIYITLAEAKVASLGKTMVLRAITVKTGVDGYGHGVYEPVLDLIDGVLVVNMTAKLVSCDGYDPHHFKYDDDNYYLMANVHGAAMNKDALLVGKEWYSPLLDPFAIKPCTHVNSDDIWDLSTSNFDDLLDKVHARGDEAVIDQFKLRYANGLALYIARKLRRNEHVTEAECAPWPILTKYLRDRSRYQRYDAHGKAQRQLMAANPQHEYVSDPEGDSCVCVEMGYYPHVRNYLSMEWFRRYIDWLMSEHHESIPFRFRAVHEGTTYNLVATPGDDEWHGRHYRMV